MFLKVLHRLSGRSTPLNYTTSRVWQVVCTGVLKATNSTHLYLSVTVSFPCLPTIPPPPPLPPPLPPSSYLPSPVSSPYLTILCNSQYVTVLTTDSLTCLTILHDPVRAYRAIAAVPPSLPYYNAMLGLSLTARRRHIT